MADIVIRDLERIVKVAFAIKKAVEMAKQNKEECVKIGERAAEVSTHMKRLKENSTAMEDPSMSDTLKSMEETLQRALTLVNECQRKQVVLRYFNAGSMSKKLRQVHEDISYKLWNGILATVVDTRIVFEKQNQSAIDAPLHQHWQHAGQVGTSQSSHSRTNQASEHGKAVFARVREQPELLSGVPQFSLSQLNDATNGFSEGCVAARGYYKMDITPLSQVRPGVHRYIICVRISRVWEFHGKNDDDPIKHLDLVIIDQQGTAMYAEVPQEAISTFRPQLQENKILIMRKIYVDNAKLSYKPVHGKYMIWLHPKTLLKEVNEGPQDFPKYTFRLTPFSELPQLEGNNEYFIDVIGRITALSDATPFHTTSGIVRMRRLVHLVDQRGNKIEVSLWGPRADEFPGQQTFKASEMNHVIVIFVGISVKSYRGSPHFLSGTAACRWYINLPEIHEINTFYASIVEQYQPIQKLHIQTTNEMQNKTEQRSFLEMKSVDPFDDMSKRFECTMAVTRIVDDEPWFYRGCTKCNTSTRYEGKKYICKQGHNSSQMIRRYTISLYATDGTCELEFMLFDERATLLIGKTAEKLLRQSNKSELPVEIKAIVGEKLTVVAKLFPGKSIHKRGPNKDNEDPTFDILSIKKRHGKDLLLSVFKREEPTVLHNTSSSQLPEVPPLVLIEPTRQDIQTSGSDAASPHDLQLMEIDQTNSVDNLSVSYKRNFKAIDDSDKEETHGADQLTVFAKRAMMKKD